MKEIRFQSLEGDLFVTFDHVDLIFLIVSGKNLISVFFGSLSLSETFIWSKGTPLLFLVDCSLLETSSFDLFRHQKTLPKKFKKLIFCDSSLGKSGFRGSGLFLGVIFGTKKIGKA